MRFFSEAELAFVSSRFLSLSASTTTISIKIEDRTSQISTSGSGASRTIANESLQDVCVQCIDTMAYGAKAISSAYPVKPRKKDGGGLLFYFERFILRCWFGHCNACLGV